MFCSLYDAILICFFSLWTFVSKSKALTELLCAPKKLISLLSSPEIQIIWWWRNTCKTKSDWNRYTSFEGSYILQTRSPVGRLVLPHGWHSNIQTQNVLQLWSWQWFCCLRWCSCAFRHLFYDVLFLGWLPMTHLRTWMWDASADGQMVTFWCRFLYLSSSVAVPAMISLSRPN